jgi:hypothetical protein
VKGEALGDDIFVGEGTRYENLTVFPILAKTQTDLGPLVSLHEALAKNDVEVRELGGGSVGANAPQRSSITNNEPNDDVQAQHGGATVNTLALENKGASPVYVLAGTIVKGGNQDRQIGQDFVIAPSETVAIDAFCVEHGRWTGTRDGAATGGKFEAVQQLANRDVRVAGQYKKDQSEVWSKVSEVNKANGKHSDSDSLLATADDQEVMKERDQLTKRVLVDLDRVAPSAAVVGYAYAIDGKVQGVRWFAHHRVFAMFREILVNTAIVDALTARATGTGAAVDAVTASMVAKFVADARAASTPATVVKTAGENTNEYGESEKSFHSKTTVKPAGKPKVSVSHDFSAK